jgi:hypothetical protein
MVAVSKFVTGIAVLSATATAKPLENRQFLDLTCLINPAVTTALSCVTGCVVNTQVLAGCAINCIVDLTKTELVRRLLFINFALS